MLGGIRRPGGIDKGNKNYTSERSDGGLAERVAVRSAFCESLNIIKLNIRIFICDVVGFVSDQERSTRMIPTQKGKRLMVQSKQYFCRLVRRQFQRSNSLQRV